MSTHTEYVSLRHARLIRLGNRAKMIALWRAQREGHISTADVRLEGLRLLGRRSRLVVAE